MRAKLITTFPVGLEPKGKEEGDQWILRALKDFDKHGGRCRIVMDVAQSTLTTLSMLINEEISELQASPPEYVSEDYFDKQTLEDLKRLRVLIGEAQRESMGKYALSGRPVPYDARPGNPAELTFAREWMELVMREELESVKLPRVRQA